MKYICAYCGILSKVKMDILEAGSKLVCEECEEITILDLFKPQERADLYRHALEKEKKL